MFFTECARLAGLYPNLARVFEKIDSQFGTMGKPEVIRAADLASLLRIQPNQMRSALDLLTQEGLLLRFEMIECAHCGMAAPRADYQEALADEDEYRCTDCDSPLADETVQTIATYRAGEKWPEAAAPTPPIRVARGGPRGKGFAANAKDHRKVVDAVAAIGDDWMANLPNLCRQLHRAGAEVPRYWRDEEMVETWDEIAEVVDGSGKSSAREKVSAHVRYRLKWIRSHPRPID